MSSTEPIVRNCMSEEMRKSYEDCNFWKKTGGEGASLWCRFCSYGGIVIDKVKK